MSVIHCIKRSKLQNIRIVSLQFRMGREKGGRRKGWRVRGDVKERG